MVAGIETAWPVGTCAVGSVTFATLGNTAIDYGTTFCQVWNDDVATPLAAIFIAGFAVLGILLILTA
jgi:hypothetical protein